MSIFSANNLEIECDSEEKDGMLLCRGKKGKTEGKVLMRASKDGMRIVKQAGSVEIVDELIKHMESRSRVKTKNDF